MVYAILDNIIIIIITLISLFTGKYPSFLIMIAGLLMVFATYKSYSEEKNKLLIVLEVILMSLFSILSCCFIGFVVFFLLREIREYVRILLGVCIFLTVALIDNNNSLAVCIMEILFLVVIYLILMFIYYSINYIENKQIQEKEKIIATNISEMHEKRLNEQLTMQNYLTEKNARLLERENISRNIHNSVGHSITAAIMTLDAADMLYDIKPNEARKKMQDANDRIRGSLESIRRAVRVLDEDSAVISVGDLKSEMNNIINEFVMDTSIRIDQNFEQADNDIKIPQDHAVFLTGVLQEMLTNGVKHGGADEFIVLLLGDVAHIRLEVSDNGRSDFDELNSNYRIDNGFGIKKIISYADKCGGKTLFINDNGFKSVVELPIINAGR